MDYVWTTLRAGSPPWKNNNLSRRKVFYVFLLETFLNQHLHIQTPNIFYM